MYKAIIQTIHEHGDILSRDWILPAYYHKKQSGVDTDYVAIAREILLGIEKADIVIVDASDRESFGVGYQTAVAINMKKPVLMIQRANAVGGIMTLGLRDTHLTYKVVDDKNVTDTVKAFLKANTVNTKDLRFNFVIDRQIYNHLRSKSRVSGKTKAEVIRDLLLKDIESDA